MVARKKGRFDILISPAWQPMLRVVGVKPEEAFVDLKAHKLHVKFGRFEQTFPLEAVESAEMAEWPLWAGVGFRYVPGTIGMVGTYMNVVRVTFKEPQRWRIVFPLPFKRLFVSLKEPEDFVAAFAEPVVVTKAA